MKTINDVKAELAHLRQIPARPRLERMMREGCGLVEMLEVLVREVEAGGMVDGAIRFVPCGSGVLPVAIGGCGATTASDGLVEVSPLKVEGYVIGEVVEEAPKKRVGLPKGKPRRVVAEVVEGGEV